MLTFSAIIGGVYLIGMISAFLKVNRWLNIKNADNDPEGLDALTAMGAAVFWPVWIVPYSVYRMTKG
jgi:hypothetical protein